MTVSGPVAADRLGTTLPHEHALVDFGGVAAGGADRYDPEDAFQLVLPHLIRAKEAGCETFVDCTPAYLGRDARLLARLSAASGVRIVTNTGYYGAANDSGVPEHAYSETVEQLAARWIAEWEEGIDGAGIRPGFIKTAFDHGPVSEIDLKLFRAALLAHERTGLTIVTHTAHNAEAARVQLEELREAGISASAWVWAHAHRNESFEDLRAAYEAGAWISLDGVREESLQKHTEHIVAARDAGFIRQVLVSHDAGWYRVGEPGGAPEKFRGYELVFTKLVPALKERGFSEEEIDTLLRINPAASLAIRVRRSE